MSKGRRKSKKPARKTAADGPRRQDSGQPPGEHAGTAAMGGGSARATGLGSSVQAPRVGWFRAKGPVFRFVVLFGLLLGLFHLVRSTSFVMDTVWPAHLRLVTQMSGAILSVFEDSLRVSGYSISSPRYSLAIARGCDAFEPCALFVSGVLAFPAPWLSKIPGALLGTLAIMVMNLVRIVSLFYIGAFWPRAFHIMHVDVWQTLFILLAILFWTYWALRATRVRSPKREKSAAAD